MILATMSSNLLFLVVLYLLFFVPRYNLHLYDYPDYYFPTLIQYLNKSDGTLPYVFVGLDSFVANSGNYYLISYSPYNSFPNKRRQIKLVPSGTGFIVYNHPFMQNGQWISCQ